MEFLPIGVIRQLAAVLLIASAVEAQDWPQFRGTDGQGHSSEKNLPLDWSESKNVAWKTRVPGLGWSSPGVARDVVTLIDRNGDRRIDGHEAEAYGRAIVRDVMLMIDARREPLLLHHVDIAAIGELMDGIGTIRITASARIETGSGRHRLTLRHDHQTPGAVFLVNLLVADAPEIMIRSQSRDVWQRELRVDYDLARPQLQAWWILAACATLGTLSVRQLKAPRKCILRLAHGAGRMLCAIAVCSFWRQSEWSPGWFLLRNRRSG